MDKRDSTSLNDVASSIASSFNDIQDSLAKFIQQNKMVLGDADSTGAVLSREQALPIGNAVQAFHTIRRLGIMLTANMGSENDEEAVALVLSIRDIAEKHGIALDECLGKISPDSSLGVFDEVQEDIDGARP